MTKEEFKDTFHRKVHEKSYLMQYLSTEGREDLINMVGAHTQPLFDEIERLKGKVKDLNEVIKLLESMAQSYGDIKNLTESRYWFDSYSMERAKNLRLEARVKELEGYKND